MTATQVRDEDPWAPHAGAPAGDGDRRDEHAREERWRPDDAEIPCPVGGPHERAEDPAPGDRGRLERPRVGAERGDVDGDECAEDAEHGEGRAAVDPGAAHVVVATRDVARVARKLDATPSTSHVTGSSKKPL